MKICIVGYGKMGQEIEIQAKKMNVEVSKIVDFDTNIENLKFEKDEVVIDFTNSEAFMKNFPIFAKKKVNIICGTTGWLENENQVIDTVNKENIGFLYSSNFSIGVNIFFKILQNASSIMNKFDDYDVMCHEIHHNRKKDSPSGTGIEAANIILKNIERKTKILSENLLNREIMPNELSISSSRCGYVFGKHDVIFDSEVDTIEISHNAKTRAGFAKGSIYAASWILGKVGYFSREHWIDSL